MRKMDQVISAYKSLAKTPSIVGARMNRDNTRIRSQNSIRNLDRGKSTKFVYEYFLNKDLERWGSSDFGADVTNELLSSISKSEKLRAVIREEKEAKDAKKQYLEIWNSTALMHSIDLNALDIHGDVYADGEFGCLNWSPDETQLVYIAEKKLVKPQPYITRKPSKDCSEIKGTEYVYKQDWGEQLVGKHLSVIVLFTVAEETFQVLAGLPDSWCPGQVCFAPDGKSVVGVSWETEPRRLGLIFCTNRPSYVFNLDFNGIYSKISSEGLAVRSPRFNNAGDRLVWLQRSAGGPHHACLQLASTTWPQTNETQILIDIVDKSVAISNGNFTGLYCLALPERCFTTNDRYIVFSTSQRTEIRSFVYKFETGKLYDISSKDVCSTSVLDVNEDVIVGVRSSMAKSTQLIVARLVDKTLTWKPVGDMHILKDRVIEYIEVETDSPDIPTIPALYMCIKNRTNVPLIVWPHGGPHSGFVNTYVFDAALFTSLGFACLQVNYRGSTGQGQVAVNILPGQAGTADVIDCKKATDDAIKKFPIDPTKIFLFGGSHGGYLVTHLSGQYPDVYAAVVTRNPVIDITSMSNTTDIPDWCAVEAGFDFTEQGQLSEEQLLAMRRCSPLAHVHKVRAPTAIMLGTNDKRVPYYQGLEYYRRLKANRCKAK